MQNTYTRDKDTDIPLNKDIQSALKQGEERVKSVMSDVEQKVKHGQEQLKNVASQVDHQLHENPWPIVAGVAISCVLLGFILGAGRRN